MPHNPLDARFGCYFIKVSELNIFIITHCLDKPIYLPPVLCLSERGFSFLCSFLFRQVYVL